MDCYFISGAHGGIFTAMDETFAFVFYLNVYFWRSVIVSCLIYLSNYPAMTHENYFILFSNSDHDLEVDARTKYFSNRLIFTYSNGKREVLNFLFLF